MFKARDEIGITKHTKNAEATTDFLDSLAPGELQKLLLDPPCLHGKGRVAQGMAATPPLAVVEAAPLALMPPKVPISNFGNLKGLDTGGLSAMVMQPWVRAALAPGSEEADQLVGKAVLYKWPERLGSWAVGKITGVNKDPKVKVGAKVCNFRVHYASDETTAEHCLEASAYARDAKSPADSWVLLGQEE